MPLQRQKCRRAGNEMSETSILQNILLKIGALPFCRFARFNAGMAWAGKAIRLKAGQKFTAQHGDVLLKGGHPIKLAPEGFPDTAGLVAVVITPEMVGQTFGKFTGIEVKTDDGQQEPEQVAWEATIKKFGGEYHIARSPDEALAIVKNIANTTKQQE